MMAPEKPEQLKPAASELLTDDHPLIKSVGGGDFLRQKLAEHRERRQRLAAMVPELIKRHPGHWVALTESGKLLIEPTLDDLAARFEELDTPPGSNAIEFLDTEPNPLIPTAWLV